MTKPPTHLIEAWVTRCRQQMQTQSIRAKAMIMFDSGVSTLIVRAEYYRNLAARLDRLSDQEFKRVVHKDYKDRCIIKRDSSSNSGSWTVTAWKPYLRSEAIEWVFTKSMKMPTVVPRTFDSVLAKAKALK